MPVIILCLFRFVRLLGNGLQAIVVENLALRRQLAAFQEEAKKARGESIGHLFWFGFCRGSGAAGGMRCFLFSPDTVVRWQRERFRKFWARLSQPDRGSQGKPAIAAEVSTPCLANG